MKFIFTLLLFTVAASSIAQDSTYLPKQSKRSNIIIISREGLQITGRVILVTLDYILLDAREFTSPVNLLAYYVRPYGNYFKIDVEYIQAAVFRAKKKTAQSAMGHAVSGAMVGGEAVSNLDGRLPEVAAGAGVGLAVGGLVGTVKGLGRKKVVVPIYGRSENLISLLNYYP